MESTTNPSTPAGEPISSPPTPAAMQVLPCSLGVAITIVSQVEVEGMTKSESTTMLCESGGPGLGEDPALLSLQELELICDLFYLPWEHGQKVGATTSVFIALVTSSQKGSHFLPSPVMTIPTQAIDVLSEFYWLKTHAGCMLQEATNEDLSTEVSPPMRI